MLAGRASEAPPDKSSHTVDEALLIHPTTAVIDNACAAGVDVCGTE
ncbi:hypothetical protein [Dryocola clanedunensis]